MFLGIFRNLLENGFLIFTFFAFLWGSKYAKSVILCQHFTFRTKMTLLALFGSHKNVKKANIKNLSYNKFLNIPRSILII